MLASAGWWVLSAPTVEREALAPPPAIDIDPPGMRAQREAALALATMPDDPWTFAESLTPSAPDKPLEKERCGLEERAQFRQPVVRDASETPLQTKAPSVRYATAQAKIDAALRASADPFDHAVADLLNVGDMMTPSGRVDALVQQALIATDARIYGMAYGVCHSGRDSVAASCAQLTARRWAELDPGNGVPWFEVLREARAAGDVSVEQDAMAHMASATRFDIRYHVAAAAVAQRLPEDADELGPVSDLAAQAEVQSAGQLVTFTALLDLCRDKGGGNESLAGQCRTVSDVMFDHSDSLLARAMGGLLYLRATGDPQRRDLYRAERAAALHQWSPATGFSECRMARDQLKLVIRSAQVGEVEASREHAASAVGP